MFKFNNSYATLDDRFYQKIKPTPVSNPNLIKLNESLALELGLDLDFLNSATGTKVMAGNLIAEGSEPIAQAYAGHQFGHFNAQLGDGRAILLGEIIDTNGSRKDIQLKGSGPTKFSRGGDGRAALGPVMREYIVSEAMHALGIATTRALAVIGTGDTVYRQSPLAGAILVRTAASHIRIGTFEYFVAREDLNALEILTNYVLERHYSNSKLDDNPYINLVKNLAKQQALLIAEWMGVGFIHGVMNTDNMSVCGETIDYGPCAFMDFYDPQTVFSSIDHQGRYAYQNQATIAQWNISCLASSLISLIDPDKDKAITMVRASLEYFQSEFTKNYQKIFLGKIGIKQAHAGDQELINDLLALMKKYKADFTLSFYYLADIFAEEESNIAQNKFFELFDSGKEDQELITWLDKWQKRLNKDKPDKKESLDLMRSSNPVYIARNHKVEEAIEKANKDQDFSYMNKLLEALQDPYNPRDGFEDYMLPPDNKNNCYQTFCGT